MSYLIKHQGKVYSPDGTVDQSTDIEAHNAAVDREVLAQWAGRPDHFHGYDCGATITTWKGAKLGDVIRRNTYRNRLTGCRMTSLRVRGINGASYYGTYGSDWANFIRLRKFK